MYSFTSIFLITISFLVMSISQASAKSVFDGPAELPRVTMSSSLADTPSPGSIVTVAAAPTARFFFAMARTTIASSGWRSRVLPLRTTLPR